MSEITPALTAEEWERFRRTHAGRGPYSQPSDDDIVRAIALDNARLPDDDPRKITRADVKLLRAYVDWMRREIPHPRLPELEAIASKLAAILPPASESDRVRDELPPLA